MNESRQTVETDTLWLSKNIRALNFRKPGHLRKYCNNEKFPIYGTYENSCGGGSEHSHVTDSVWKFYHIP